MDDLPIFLQADMEFHQQLVRASGNVVLVTAFLAIYEYHRFSSVFTSQQEGEERLAQTCHRNLLVALAKKDAQTCRRILAGHLDHMTRYGKTTR